MSKHNNMGPIYSATAATQSLPAMVVHRQPIPAIINQVVTADLISFGNAGKEVVVLKSDGRVIWGEDKIDIDAASEAFAQSIRYGAAESGGITKSVRKELKEAGWDAAFSHLIELAEMNGSLTRQDLTDERERCIIIKKLAE